MNIKDAIRLHKEGRLPEARAICEAILTIKPHHFYALHLLGVIAAREGEHERAAEIIEQALRARTDAVPDSDAVQAFYNRGLSLQKLNRLDDAIASYDGAIVLNSGYVEAHWNKALALLLAGRFAQGWPEFEWRWKRGRDKAYPRDFSAPLWLGADSLAGKTILLHSEQGLGDTLHFCRYASLVADRAARVILEVQPPLVSLLKDVPGVSAVLAQGETLPPFDTHCPLLSLPLAFKTDLASIPSPGAYLRSAPDKAAIWAERLGRKTGPRVGLVWSGSSTHKNDANRNIPLSLLRAHLPPHITYVSLQKEIRETDAADLGAQPSILHFGTDLHDFADTAALAQMMDVVVSVDTSVAHLSAALGKATWIVLPFVPDWRWLLERDDSPWYSSARLYRQTRDRQWSPVLQRLRADLTALT